MTHFTYTDVYVTWQEINYIAWQMLTFKLHTTAVNLRAVYHIYPDKMHTSY
jgi:hypothetical protein